MSLEQEASKNDYNEFLIKRRNIQGFCIKAELLKILVFNIFFFKHSIGPQSRFKKIFGGLDFLLKPQAIKRFNCSLKYLIA